MNNQPSIFFTSGGLPEDFHTYVDRLADEVLYDVVCTPNANNLVCCIFAPHQTGKTSLLKRVSKKLREDDYICIDITLQLSTEAKLAEQMWSDFLHSFCQSFERLVDPNSGLVKESRRFWRTHYDLSPSIRFKDFLVDNILPKVDKKLVIFVDEIQTLISWNQQIAFASFIKSISQDDRQRELEKVFFVLLGVTKSEDIFPILNLGERTALEYLDIQNCQPLIEGLSSFFDAPELILEAIFEWTNGQPFLTQRICQLLEKNSKKIKGPDYKKAIKSFIVEEVIKPWKLNKDDQISHFTNIEKFFVNADNVGYKTNLGLLSIYKKLFFKKSLRFETANLNHIDLLLTGLVIKDGSFLKISNQVYEKIFDLEWIREGEQQLCEHVSFFLKQSVQRLFFDTVKIDLKEGTEKLKYEKKEALFYYEESFLNLEMIAIKGGNFEMGGNAKEELISERGQKFYKEWYENELPAHSVTLPDFFIGRYAVTQSQYEEIMEINPSYHKGLNLPVENVSWQDAMIFCQKLSKRTGNNYRLPTEAEWEYACRAGTTDSFAFGETVTKEIINYNGYRSSRDRFSKSRDAEQSWSGTIPVGSLPANAWGLHEMHGNVQEWCADQWYESYSQKEKTLRSNGSIAWTKANTSMSNRFPPLRVARGGCFTSCAFDCRSAVRERWLSSLRSRTIGFRVALSFND